MSKRQGVPHVRPGWSEWPGNDCLWIEFVTAEILPIDLHLADGKTLKVGARLGALGGRQTSVSKAPIRMLPGQWLEYRGCVKEAGDTLVLFSTPSQADAFVGFYAIGGDLLHSGDLFFHTPAHAGRCVETDACEWFGESA